MPALSFRLFAACFALAVFASCGGDGLGTATTGKAIRAAEGYDAIRYDPGHRRVPRGWSGVDLAGRPISNRVLQGKVSVVNFWASWCGPCRAEQEHLENVWAAYQPKGVQFLGVDFRDQLASARAHVDEYHVTYPSVVDDDSTITYKYRLTAIPSTFVLDAHGRIAARIIGATTDESKLTEILDQVMAE